MDVCDYYDVIKSSLAQIIDVFLETHGIIEGGTNVALDVGLTIASPTVIESNSGFGRCLACRTRSSVLLLFNRRLFQSIHWFSSRKHTSAPVCADTTSSILVLFMLRYS